jgi:hypothetical protein
METQRLQREIQKAIETADALLGPSDPAGFARLGVRWQRAELLKREQQHCADRIARLTAEIQNCADPRTPRAFSLLPQIAQGDDEAPFRERRLDFDPSRIVREELTALFPPPEPPEPEDPDDLAAPADSADPPAEPADLASDA